LRLRTIFVVQEDWNKRGARGHINRPKAPAPLALLTKVDVLSEYCRIRAHGGYMVASIFLDEKDLAPTDESRK